MQFICSTVVCLTQYLGLGTIYYQSDNAIALSAQNQGYYCRYYNTVYTCLKVTDDTNLGY